MAKIEVINIETKAQIDAKIKDGESIIIGSSKKKSDLVFEGLKKRHIRISIDLDNDEWATVKNLT